MKSYTDIEQSRELAKILPLDSSDMYWWEAEGKEYIYVGKCTDNNGIPAWSLAALFSVLPNEIIDDHFITLDREDEDYCCYYEDALGDITSKFFMSSDNPVDACYKMIIKLHEQRVL